MTIAYLYKYGSVCEDLTGRMRQYEVNVFEQFQDPCMH